MRSIVIAAHNEGRVIGRCLDALLSGAQPGEFDVVVVANGCQDDTAIEASNRPGVRVLELESAGKAAALNAGDTVAHGFPRVFLDADMIVTTDDVRRVCAAVEGHDSRALIAFPQRQVESSGCPIVVRAYFAINARLPVFREGAFGRGMIALSEEGRRRFSCFPDVVADDLFLDGLFQPPEKLLVEQVSVMVAAPRDTRELVNRLVRVRRGNAALRRAFGQGRLPRIMPARRGSWVVDVLLTKPSLAPAGLVYAAISAWAAARARCGPLESQDWGRLEKRLRQE